MIEITNTRLYDKVFTDAEKFVRAMAIEHTCANLGMDHLLDDDHDIESVYQQLLEEFYSAKLSELSGGRRITGPMEGQAERLAEDAVNGELKSWLEQARGDFEKIKAQGKPWTLRSSREVFGV